MGITLTSKTINSTYDSLLKLSDNDSLTGAFKVVTDGLGNDTGLSLNSAGDAQLSGTFTINTKVITPLLQLSGGVGTQGSMSWNTDEETVDLILNGSTLQLGQEVHVHVRNNSVTTAIPNGTPVYVTGTLGASGRLKVAPMIADGTISAEYFIGVTTEEIGADEDGKVTWFGKVRGFDTSGYTEGSKLYVSETVAGGWQTTEPTSPNPKLEVAFTVNQKSNGAIFVRGGNGQYLHNNHDVKITSVADKDLLVYNSTDGIWENSKTLGAITTGNITTSGTVDGVDISAFKTAYDSHNHDSRYYTETELDAGQLDNRYYTETESDAKYLLNTTDTLTGDLTLTGKLSGPSVFYIDPSPTDVYGDGTYGEGKVVIQGDLEVTGQTTTVNSTEVTINDKNLLLGYIDVVKSFDTVSTSTTLTLNTGDLSGVVAGMGITGSGIPADTTVVSITDATHIVISNAATATATGVSITFSMTSSMADGAGITINGAGATLTYASATDDFNFNKNVSIADDKGLLIGNVSNGSNIGIGSGIRPSNTVGHYASDDEGIFWHSSSTSNYGIFRTAGSWTSPSYQKLKLRWPVGIELDGGSSTYTNYGVNIINDSPLRMKGSIVIDSSRNITAGTISGSTGSFSSSVSIQSTAANFVGLSVGTSATSYVRQDFKTDSLGAGKAYLIAYGSANPNDGAFAIKSIASHATTNDTAGDTFFENTIGETMRIHGDTGAITMTYGLTAAGLVIDNVDWNSNKVRIEGSSPNIEFRGTDAGDIYWQLGSNGDKFYILDDADKDGDFDGSPYPFQLDNTNTQLQVFGNRVLTTADEGSGNGLDADTLDGQHASDFLRANATDTATGNLTFSGVNTFNGSATFNDDITLNHSATGQTVDGITITNIDGDGVDPYTGVLSVESGDKLTWNGYALLTTLSAGAYVSTGPSGDTMEGNLTISNTAPLLYLKDSNSTGATDSYGQIKWYDSTNAELAAVGFYGADSKFYIDAYGSDVYIGDNLQVNGDATITGTLEISGADSENAFTISGSSPTISLKDTTTDADDFYIHVNSNNFYILRDQGGVGDYGVWDSPHPLQLEADTGNAYVYGNTIITSGNIGSQSVANANKWTTARTITLGGDLTGSVSIDGSANVTLSAQVADDSHNHDGRYYTETEVNRSLAELAGWVPAYSNANTTTVNWDKTNEAVALSNVSGGDQEIGMSYKAIRMKAGDKVRIGLMTKGSVADTDGFYIRIYFYNGDLPDGKTHVSNSASYTYVQEDSSGDTGWWENNAVTTTWKNFYRTYTAPADGYMSIVILNWAGYAGTLYVKQPDIQFEKVNDSNLLDGLDSSQFLRSDTSDTMSGVLTVNSGSGNNPAIFQSTDSVSYVTIKDSTAETRLVNAGSDFQIEVNNGNAVAKFFSDGDMTIYGDNAPKLTLHNEFVTGDWSGITDLGSIEWYTPDTSGNAPYTTGFIRNENETGGTLPSGALVFGTTAYNNLGGAVERMRIDSSGRLLVGRQSYISGADYMKIQSETSVGATNGNKVLYLYNNGSTIKLDAYDYDTSAALNVQLGGNGGNIIVPTGRVGVGATSPQSKLHVYQNDATTGTDCGLTIEQDGTGDAKLQFLLTSVYRWVFGIDNSDGDKFKIGRGSNWSIGADININTSGQVGIGTNSPSAVLHVADQASQVTLKLGRASGVATIKSDGTADGHMIIDSGTSSYGVWLQNYTSGNVYLVTGGGNVGIGDTTPDARLQIGTGTTNSSNRSSVAIFSGSNSGGLVDGLSLVNSGSASYGNGIALNFHNANNYSPTGAIRTWQVASGTITDAYMSFYTYQSGLNEGMRLTNVRDLHVDGDIVAYSTTISDRRLKDDIETIPNALDKVKSMRGVSYVWNNGSRKGQKDLGLIAQEVEEVLPEIVREKEMALVDGETYKTVDYEKMVGVLIEAIKEQQEQIDELKRRLDGNSTY